MCTDKPPQRIALQTQRTDRHFAAQQVERITNLEYPNEIFLKFIFVQVLTQGCESSKKQFQSNANHGLQSILTAPDQ